MRTQNPGAGSLGRWNPSVDRNHKIMKVVRKNANGETRELLLKEYFLNAYLIALLKRVGEGAAKFSKAPELQPVRVRSGR
jgi:hypothetical protein